MESSKNRMVFGAFVLIAVIGVLAGTLQTMDGPASAGNASKHFITAEPVRDSPANAKMIKSTDNHIKDNEMIQQAVDRAVRTDQHVNIKLDKEEFNEVKSTLIGMPEYGEEWNSEGLLVKEDGTVIKINIHTANAR